MPHQSDKFTLAMLAWEGHDAKRLRHLAGLLDVTDPAVRKGLRNAYKRNEARMPFTRSRIHYAINASAKYRALLDAQFLHPRDEAMIVTDQMDCDCARYTSSRTVPAHPIAVARAVYDVYDDAEGPVYSVQVIRPTTIEHTSRDLALEAFEDGHPHVVYA